MNRTRPCDGEVRAGRLRKAEQFWEQAQRSLALADGVEEVADAAVSLLVLAGTAAADVVCCARLGEHAQGESHAEAVALLRRAERSAAGHLQRLLTLKSGAAYGHRVVSPDEVRRAQRAAEALLEAARGTR